MVARLWGERNIGDIVQEPEDDTCGGVCGCGTYPQSCVVTQRRASTSAKKEHLGNEEVSSTTDHVSNGSNVKINECDTSEKSRKKVEVANGKEVNAKVKEKEGRGVVGREGRGGRLGRREIFKDSIRGRRGRGGEGGDPSGEFDHTSFDSHPGNTSLGKGETSLGWDDTSLSRMTYRS